MTPKENESEASKGLVVEIIETILRFDTWRKVGMFIILSTWGALIWDFAINRAQVQRDLFTTFAGASKRPVLFAEDYKFINSLLNKYPGSNISVIEINYLAGLEGEPLKDIVSSEKIVINRGGVPIAAILISPSTDSRAKAEALTYFRGNDNISPLVPLISPSPTPNDQYNTPNSRSRR